MTSGCLLPDTNSSRLSTLPSNRSRWQHLPVQGIVFRPFDSSSGLHQGVRPSFRVGSQEGDTSTVISKQPVGNRKVDSSPSATSAASLLGMSGSRDCHQLGEIGPRAHQYISVSQNGDRYQLREGLSDRLLDCQTSGSGR